MKPTREQYLQETATQLYIARSGGAWASPETPEPKFENAFEQACEMADYLEQKGCASWLLEQHES